MKRVCAHWDVQYTDDMIHWNGSHLDRIFDSVVQGGVKIGRPHEAIRTSQGIITENKTDKEIKICTNLKDIHQEIQSYETLEVVT